MLLSNVLEIYVTSISEGLAGSPINKRMHAALPGRVCWPAGREICHVQPSRQPGVTFELDRGSYLDMRSAPLKLLCMKAPGSSIC